MKTKITRLAVAAFFIGFSFLSRIQAQPVNTQDSLALVDLYNSTNGPQWTQHDNWLTAKPVRTWYGITVNNGRVTETDLTANHLTGKIPVSIGQLTSLDFLRLNINSLSDTIPATVGNLIHLTRLELGINSLTGSIPSSLGNLTQLQQLGLESNRLSGVIPSSVGNLTQLNSLDFSSNQLKGRIPSSIGNLVNLEFLILFENELKDSIPDRIGKLQKLRSLNLSYNQLTGEIPSSLLMIKTLQFVLLNSNKLTNAKGTVYPSSQPHKNVQLNVSENRLNFDILEFIDSTFPDANTNGQAFLKIHQNGNQLSVYAGGTLSANKYFWKKAGQLAATITGDSTFQPTEPGLYSVFIQNAISNETLNSYNYKYTGAASNLLSSSVADNKLPNQLILYPNPAHSILQIRLNGTAEIVISDASGQTLVHQKMNGNPGINVSMWQPGVYYLINRSTNEKQSFIVSR